MSVLQAERPTRIREVLAEWVKLPNLGSIIERTDGKLLATFLDNRWFRRAVLGVLGRRLDRYLMDEPENPLAARKERAQMGRALLRSVSRFLDGAQRKEPIRRALLERVIPALMEVVRRQPETLAAFRERYGENPPGFLTISPTRNCNLNCTGCYANSTFAPSETLEFDIVDRILEEKKRLWGSWFTVISGGEPFMYRSGGRNIFDVFRRHPDNFFLVYTNGTLINGQAARRLAELGNVSLAISVEGFEEQTDRRRGKGTYARILSAFERLKGYGVPYGVSFTAFGHNAELVDEALFRRYLEELGALYIWIFQYMPIGREQTLDLLVTPEQRLGMYRRTWKAVRERKMFIADFWNSGSASSGCIAAGRPGGYLYIDWNGNITPCVFNPYSPLNIREVYRGGGDLNDVLQHPFFREIRRWQSEYALDRPAEETGNFMTPCPIRDHYDFMLPLLRRHSPRPIDLSGAEALNDRAYQHGLIAYGKALSEMMDPIWEREVLAPERANLSG